MIYAIERNIMVLTEDSLGRYDKISISITGPIGGHAARIKAHRNSKNGSSVPIFKGITDIDKLLSDKAVNIEKTTEYVIPILAAFVIIYNKELIEMINIINTNSARYNELKTELSGNFESFYYAYKDYSVGKLRKLIEGSL